MLAASLLEYLCGLPVFSSWARFTCCSLSVSYCSGHRISRLPQESEIHFASFLRSLALSLMATEPANSRLRYQAARSSLRPSQQLPKIFQPESPDLTLTRCEDSLDSGPERPGFSLQISSNSQDPVIQPQKDWEVAPTIVSQPANKGGWKQNT